MQHTLKPIPRIPAPQTLWLLAGIYLLLGIALSFPFQQELTRVRYASSVQFGNTGLYLTMLSGYQSVFGWIHIALLIGMSLAANTGRKLANILGFFVLAVLFVLWSLLLQRLTTTSVDASRPTGVYLIWGVAVLIVLQGLVALFRRKS
jgi:cell division protein FtsW (lipid II flippase)